MFLAGRFFFCIPRLRQTPERSCLLLIAVGRQDASPSGDMTNREQFRLHSAFRKGVPGGLFFERRGIRLLVVSRDLRGVSTTSSGTLTHPSDSKVRSGIFSNPQRFMLPGGIFPALGAVARRPTVRILLLSSGKEHSPRRKRQSVQPSQNTSSEALSVPIRNDPEMVVKLRPQVIGAGLQRTEAAAA